MLQSVDAARARNSFSDLVGQVYYGGKRFLIRKLGKPFAVLVSADEYLQFEKAREGFFKQAKLDRSSRRGVKFSQVEKDIREAISAVRKKK
jgi:prevent-host-death family protein